MIRIQHRQVNKYQKNVLLRVAQLKNGTGSPSVVTPIRKRPVTIADLLCRGPEQTFSSTSHENAYQETLLPSSPMPRSLTTPDGTSMLVVDRAVALSYSKRTIAISIMQLSEIIGLPCSLHLAGLAGIDTCELTSQRLIVGDQATMSPGPVPDIGQNKGYTNVDEYVAGLFDKMCAEQKSFQFSDPIREFLRCNNISVTDLSTSTNINVSDVKSLCLFS
jgi:hypothetical protein